MKHEDYDNLYKIGLTRLSKYELVNSYFIKTECMKTIQIIHAYLDIYKSDRIDNEKNWYNINIEQLNEIIKNKI